MFTTDVLTGGGVGKRYCFLTQELGLKPSGAEGRSPSGRLFLFTIGGGMGVGAREHLLPLAEIPIV